MRVEHLRQFLEVAGGERLGWVEGGEGAHAVEQSHGRRF
jgi:hypothetical protein